MIRYTPIRMSISGSEWVEKVKGLSRAQVMASVIEHVRAGDHVPWPMVEISADPCSAGLAIRVASDVLAIGTLDDHVRAPLDAPTAQIVADLTGCLLPTSKISDLIWRQAPIRLQPLPMGPPSYPYDASMMSIERAALHSLMIDEQLAPLSRRPQDLVAGHKKDVVLSTRLQQHPGRVAIYGWHRPTGQPIQGPEVSIVHEASYYDYSHGVRLVSRDATLQGEPAYLPYLLQDPTYARVISREGPVSPLLYRSDTQPPQILPPTISLGRSNDPAAVSRWQQVIGAASDGVFGPATESLTREWQRAHGLTADGIVGPLTWRRALGIDPPSTTLASSSTPGIPFVQAKHYRAVPATAPRGIDLVVIHTMEAVEHPLTAENVAHWFRKGCPDAHGVERRASSHYCVDEDSVVQCVLDQDVAFCAPGTNHNGIHLEHAGYSAQTHDQWADPYSQAMLARSARLTAQICQRYSIPIAFVDWKALLVSGTRGITYHREVSYACRHAQSTGMRDSPFFNQRGARPLTDHTDPGGRFPIDSYLQMIRDQMAELEQQRAAG